MNLENVFALVVKCQNFLLRTMRIITNVSSVITRMDEWHIFSRKASFGTSAVRSELIAIVIGTRQKTIKI